MWTLMSRSDRHAVCHSSGKEWISTAGGFHRASEQWERQHVLWVLPPGRADCVWGPVPVLHVKGHQVSVASFSSFAASFEYPPKWCTCSAVWFVTWLVPCETSAVLACSVYTIQPHTMSCHFMQNHVPGWKFKCMFKLHQMTWAHSSHWDCCVKECFDCYYYYHWFYVVMSMSVLEWHSYLCKPSPSSLLCKVHRTVLS